jgi:plasmid stability protein
MTSGEVSPTWDLHMMIAALRADRTDVESYSRVLTNMLGDALPNGMVDVEYRRSMGDRVSGKPGQAVAVRVRAPERELELRQGRHGVEAEVRTVVRNVVISRKQVPIDEWLVVLAEELNKLAARDAVAREVLSRLFSG